MRRDVCYYFPASVDQLYNAYLSAATNSRFRRECNQEPYHTLGFGLNFSMMYNFNGGACTLRFMPYQGGSAVNMRFSIAQLAGARYEKYANDLTEDASAVLGISGQKIDLDVDLFVEPTNMVTPERLQPTCNPVSAPPQTKGNVCAACGFSLREGDRFCSECGKPVAENKKFCSNCGKEALPGASFCSNCGNRL